MDKKPSLKKMNRGLIRSYERNDRKTRRSRRSRKSSGSRRDNTLDLNIISLCSSILKIVNDIQMAPHLEILDKELIKYNLAFTNLIFLKLSSIDQFKDLIKSMKINKVIHYDHYRQNSTPILIRLMLNIYLQEITLLLDVIKQYNIIDIPYDEPGLTNWKKDIDDTYHRICSEFSQQLPCMEGYIATLHTLLNTMRTPPRPQENIRQNVLLTLDDFTNDGDFFMLTENVFDKWQIIQLSIVAFKNVLCGTRNSCTENFEEVRQSFNIHNYDLFLEYLDFYNHFAYLDITPEIVGMVSIDIEPNSEPINKICCKKDFVTNLGGKRK